MPTNKEKRQLIWGVAILLILTVVLPAIIRIATHIKASAEQQALAERLLKEVKGAVKDPGTGYIVCPPKTKFIINEEVVTFHMCGREITVKKSWRPRLERANIALERTTGHCIKVNGSVRSNYRELEFILGGRTPIKAKKGEPPEHKSCTTSHTMGQAVDVNNFDEAMPFLEAEGFVGGYPGVMCDPWHVVDAKKDTVRKGGYGHQALNRACVTGKNIRRWLPW